MNPIISFRLDKPTRRRMDWPKLALRLFVGALAVYGAVALMPGCLKMIAKRVGG